MKQKILRFRWLIIAVMVLAFVPKEVQAQEILGAFTVTKGDGGECSFADNKLTVTAGTVTVSTESQTAQTIVLNGAAKLILNGVNISTNAASPIEVSTGSNVEIELAENTSNTLSAGYYNAGIHVAVGSTVTFTGSGTLEAKNTTSGHGSYSCGIGGRRGVDGGSCGTIIFDLDGTITAKGGDRASGIGTISSSGQGCILIKKGTINATGGYCASGIGTGPDGGSGSVKIFIEGGTITANGNLAAGIGCGFNAGNFNHLIVGPDVTVNGSIANYVNGIVFSGNPKTATMIGDVTIPQGVDLTINESETLIVPEGKALTIEEGGSLTNNGTIIIKDCLIGNGGTIPENIGGIVKYEYERTGLTKDNYGTICLPYAVMATDISGAEFFSIAGKVTKSGNVTHLVLEESKTGLAAGTPYIYKAAGNTLSCMYFKDNAAESPNTTSSNGLIGSFTETEVSAGDADNVYYALKGNKLYKCGDNNWKIEAYRAYIKMNEVSEYTESSSAQAKTIKIGVSDDGATGIGAVTAAEHDGVYYNLHGQRVAEPSRGIYIVNGKKIIVK